MDPRLGTDTSGPGEAVFAIRFNGKSQNVMKTYNFKISKNQKNPKTHYAHIEILEGKLIRIFSKN